MVYRKMLEVLFSERRQLCNFISYCYSNLNFIPFFSETAASSSPDKFLGAFAAIDPFPPFLFSFNPQLPRKEKGKDGDFALLPIQIFIPARIVYS